MSILLSGCRWVYDESRAQAMQGECFWDQPQYFGSYLPSSIAREAALLLSKPLEATMAFPRYLSSVNLEAEFAHEPSATLSSCPFIRIKTLAGLATQWRRPYYNAITGTEVWLTSGGFVGHRRESNQTNGTSFL
jgi:hypothetical protein